MKGANCKDALCDATASVGPRRRVRVRLKRQMKSEFGMRRVVNGRVTSVQRVAKSCEEWQSERRSKRRKSCFLATLSQ